MPWEKNFLFFASIDNDGEMQEIREFPSKVIKEGKNVFSGHINEILNEVFLSELYETKLKKIITEDGYSLFF